jgi:predicted component of type VI protein secretion system
LSVISVTNSSNIRNSHSSVASMAKDNRRAQGILQDNATLFLHVDDVKARQKHTRFPLGTNAFISVGRTSGCAVILKDPIVSRHHFLFRTLDETCWFEDIGLNRAHFNGQRCKPSHRYQIRPGDILKIGRYEIRVTASDLDDSKKKTQRIDLAILAERWRLHSQSNRLDAHMQPLNPSN